MQTEGENISYRNLFQVYGLILLLLGFILIKTLLPKFPLSQPVLFGLLIGSILSLLIYNRKYLLTLEINDINLKVSYFRYNLIPKTIQFSIEQIDKVVCKKSNILSRNELIIILKNDSKEYKFDIPKNKMTEFLGKRMEFSSLINIIEK